MKTIEMYQKPQAEFLDMQSNHALADTCWGNHGKGVTYEYQCPYPKEGEHAGHELLFVKFQIKKGGCKFTEESVEFKSPLPPELEKEFWEQGNSQPVKTPPFYPDSNPS